MKVKYYDLESKRVFITGHGSGIGASIVEHFCEQGSEVYFIDINEGISNEQSTINIEDANFNIPKQFETSKSNKNFFGIRPENLSLTNEGGLKGSVFGVEYLGSRKIITVKTNIGEIKVKADISINIKLNENVQIKPANDSIIIFDGETDKSLKSEFMK